MRAPAFWWAPQPDAIALALSPLGYVWGLIARRRLQKSGSEATLPVICIGNFVAGGAGKTPTAIACASLLAQAGKRPVFLSRGYGGSASRAGAPLRVDPGKHTAAIAGDEALLLARQGQAIVAANRVAGARSAAQTGADVIVMDDGLQNPSLQKNFRIAVADGETGIGNGLCIPAGPLRAPMADQFAIVDALIVIGPGAAGDRLAGRALSLGIPVFRGALRPDPQAVQRLKGQRVVAFAGIGRPEKFFAMLEQSGADVRDAYSFDDHQMLNKDNLTALRIAARHHSARLVTTEKDLARLEGLNDTSGIDVLPVTLALDDEPAFKNLMLQKIAAAED